MAVSSFDPPVEYQVRVDPDAYCKIIKAGLKKYAVDWFLHGLKLGVTLVVFLYSGVFAYIFVERHYSPVEGLLAVAILALLFGFGWMLWVVSQQLQAAQQADDGTVWDCRLTEDGWTYQRRGGHLTYIPWQAMSLVLRQPEGYLLKYGPDDSFSVVVMAKPLKELGIEDEFIERIGLPTSEP